jgi:hypothetical protein
MNKAKGKRAAKFKKAKYNWIIAVLKDFGAAAEKTADVLDLRDAPEWVWNAWDEIGNMIVPNGFLPIEKWNAEFLGNILGRLHGVGMIMSGEIPLGPETAAELDKFLQRPAKKMWPKDLKNIQKDFGTVMRANRKAITTATNAAMAAPYQERMAFQKALTKGMEIQPDDLATPRTFRRHTRTFWVLALYWRAWVKCRSVREVYQHLCNAVGENKIGSFKTFETHIAKKIGLKIRGRGRPKAAK